MNYAEKKNRCDVVLHGKNEGGIEYDTKLKLDGEELRRTLKVCPALCRRHVGLVFSGLSPVIVARGERAFVCFLL